MRRPGRLALSSLVVFLVAVTADYAVWRVATDRLTVAWLEWQARLAAAGWHVASDGTTAGGWPFAAELRLAHLRLAQQGSAGFGWAADRVTVGVSLLQPHVLRIAAPGPQSVTAFGYAPLRFTARQLLATVPLAAPVRSARVRAAGLAFQTGAGQVSVSQADVRLAWDAGDARFVLGAGQIAVPPGRAAALGPVIDSLALNLAAIGAWRGGNARAAADAWRQGGGVVAVRQATLRWGTLALDATGDARLDGALQPEAALDVRLNDPAAALAALQAAGAIDQGTAVAAGAVLQILAIPARLAGESGALDLPLALKAGAVTLARIPMANVPPVRW